jgi:alkylation response protein AidB-like acyl-CoA dehydrogenase
LRERFLPALARGELYATVGLSQLTTSRQHQAPALVATPLGSAAEPDGYRLDGVIPWVTGADQAGLVVIGAALADSRQVLLALPAGRPGVTVETPLRLAALSGSRTTLIRCNDVRLEADLVLAGPAEKAVSSGGTVGGLETSTLALGLAGAAIDFLHDEARRRPDLVAAAERFESARRRARERLHGLALHRAENADLIAVRVSCTRLALQASQVALAVAKGTGFAAPHPARRWATQALFFLVWSCPRPAAEGMIAALLPDEE